MVGVWGFILLLGFQFAATAGTGGNDTELRTIPSRKCPGLFGDQSDHDENRSSRLDSLESVALTEYSIELVHMVDWETPEKVSLAGLVLKETSVDENDVPFAVLELEDSLDGIDCKPGLYIIRVDDSIGEDVRVLAIIEKSVLVEHGDDLAYLGIEGTQDPVWRLIWRSSWKMPRVPDSSRYQQSRSPRRKTSRKRRRGRR